MVALLTLAAVTINQPLKAQKLVEPMRPRVKDGSKSAQPLDPVAPLTSPFPGPCVVRTGLVPDPPAAEMTGKPTPDGAESTTATDTSDARQDFPTRPMELSHLFLTPGAAVVQLFPATVVDKKQPISSPAPDTPVDLPPLPPELSGPAPTAAARVAQRTPSDGLEVVEPTTTTAATATVNLLEASQPASLGVPSPGSAQAASAPAALPNDPEGAKSKRDNQVEQTACAACGGFHSHADGPALHESMNCSNGICTPGRAACNAPSHESDNFVSAFLNNLYDCLCCPDPCYQPHWEPAANASFFADYARPRTVTRLRYDNLEDMTRPDRNQFWLQAPSQATGKIFGNVKNLSARLQEVYLYQEAAGPSGSFFIETGYRQLNPNYMPTQAGFSDLNFGIKSLFFECELLQLSFQFRTYMPTGNAADGLGTGHISLDPSILASLKLGPDTYFQGQFGNWIPIGASSPIAGGMFYWLTSLNQVLWYTRPDSPLIGTLEMDGWSFENGGYTSAFNNGSAKTKQYGGGVSYFNMGPGLRQVICNRLDFGGAITWATATAHWAQPWCRFELRFLF